MLHSDMLAIALQINQTSMIVGLPGIGKTAVTKELVKQISLREFKNETSFPLVFQSLAQIMPEDLAGAQVPNHQSRTMDAYMMGTIKPLVEAKRGVYFGDEYGSCSGAVRAAFLNAAQDRLFGDTYLPDVAVVCAMNPPDVATNGQDMTAPESNRFFWINWNLENSPWFDYMLGGLGAAGHAPLVPKGWKTTHLPRAKSLIVSFLKRHQQYVHKMPTADKATGPWPSHRSWTNAAHMFGATRAAGFDLTSDHVDLSVKGAVGKDVGDMFFNWVRAMDLPDPEDLLADPKNAHKLLPERHDHCIVALESLATAAIEKSHKDHVKRWNDAWVILDPVIKSHQDRAEPAAKILSKDKPQGCDFPEGAVVLLKNRRELGISRSSA